MAIAFGIVPHVDDEATRAALGGLCTQLTTQTGIEVKPFVASTPMALALAVGDQSVQLAWLSPTLMLEASLEGVIPLLSTGREGLHAYHSIVAVPQTSPIRKPEELRGRTMAWVARTSAAGYIVPRLSLARRGINVRKLFGREVFLTSHAAVARAVADGRADAGATYAVFANGNPAHSIIRSGFRDFAPEVPFRILDIGGPLPADMICAHPSAPDV